jgi:hypothetical protein
MCHTLLETDEYLLYLDRLAGVVKDPPDSKLTPGAKQRLTVVIGDARFEFGEDESARLRDFLRANYRLSRLDDPLPGSVQGPVSHGEVEP